MDNQSENEAQASELNSKLVKELKQHRSNIKAQLSRFQTFLNNFSVDNKYHLSQLQHRLVNVEGLLDKYNDIHTRLLTTDCDDHIDDHLNQLQEFEDQYYELVAIARDFTEGNSSSKSIKFNNQGGSQPGNDLPRNNEVFQVVQQRSSVEQDDANTCSDQEREQSVVSVPRIHRQNQSSYVVSQQPIKLPVIELPTFSGRAEEWLQFFDTFDTLIHSNEALSEIQKFYYLKSSLKGDAEQVIHSLEVSARNYEIAWSILKERYQNNKLIIHNHVRALFDHPVIQKESHIALRKLLDETIKNLRVLKSFEQPVDTWDTILVYLLTTKLDSTTKREWESINITNDAPTFDNFVQFLTARCQLLETLHSNKDSKGHFEAQSNRFHQNKGTFSKSFITSNQEDNKNKCFYCKNVHYIFFCSKFLDLPVKSRIQEIKTLL